MTTTQGATRRLELLLARTPDMECADDLRVVLADAVLSRRLLDDARTQKPYGYEIDWPLSEGGVDKILTTDADDIEVARANRMEMLPVFTAPVPAQPAAVPEAVAKDVIPAGWVFYSADASIQSSDPRRPMAAMIKRDVDGVQWWLQLTEEEKEATPLYSSGAGMTLTLAIQNAVAAILSAADTEVKK